MPSFFARPLTRAGLLLLLLGTSVALSACHTMEGLGQDLSTVRTRSARKHRSIRANKPLVVGYFARNRGKYAAVKVANFLPTVSNPHLVTPASFFIPKGMFAVAGGRRDLGRGPDDTLPATSRRVLPAPCDDAARSIDRAGASRAGSALRGIARGGSALVGWSRNFLRRIKGSSAELRSFSVLPVRGCPARRARQ
jgi:predicted small secreted protein